MAMQLLGDTLDRDVPVEKRGMLRKFLDMADSGSKRMDRTISELLAFVDLQRQGVPEPRMAVNMERICRILVDRMKPLWESRKLTVDISFSPDTPPVSGNTDILTCAMEHLIHNAILFNKEGGKIAIHGDIRRERVCISVSDTGEGIPDTEFDKIFDSFYQIASYLTRKVEGLGLGLATTRRIVELHGGDITVSSKVGEGTTFNVYLLPAQQESK
jgi:signal transduction histidine kinase